MNQSPIARLGKAALRLIGVKDNQSSERAANVHEGLVFGLRSQVLSPRQAILYRALVAALAADAVVFSKVRLTDFLYLSDGGVTSENAKQLDGKYVDFLLCDPFTMQPLAVVELAEGKSSRPRDPFVAHALKTAELSMLRIESRSTYPVLELRRILLPKIRTLLQDAEADRNRDLSAARPKAQVADVA